MPSSFSAVRLGIQRQRAWQAEAASMRRGAHFRQVGAPACPPFPSRHFPRRQHVPHSYTPIVASCNKHVEMSSAGRQS